METLPTLRPGAVQWSAVIAVALALHLALAAAFFDRSDSVQGNALQAGSGGLNVGLGAVAFDEATLQRLAEPRTVSKPEPVTEAKAKTEAETRPETPPVKTEPLPETTSSQDSQALKISDVTSRDSQLRQPQDNADLSDPEPTAANVNDAEQQTQSAEQPTEQPTEEQQNEARADAAAPSQAREKSTGAAADQSSGGHQGASDDYLQQLLGWLNQHKRYPAKARRRREEGTVYVAFTMQRDGTVTAKQIHRSSGHAALDKAALKVLTLASPLPPVPQGVYAGKTSLSLVMPVDYSFIDR